MTCQLYSIRFFLDKAKDNIPKQYRIGDTYFTSLTTIVSNLFTKYQNILNHVHKNSNDILPVIIILRNNVHGGETVFYDGVNMNDIGKRAHVLKHSHGKCVVGAFDKYLHEVSIWTGHRSSLSFILHKSIFIYFVHHGTGFYEKYITSDHRKKYMDDHGSGALPKQMARKLYNENYQNTYSNRYYILKKDYIKIQESVSNIQEEN